MPFLFSLLVIVLMVGALIDIITREDSQVRFLPKMAWIVIVILLPLIGGLLVLLVFGIVLRWGLRRPLASAIAPSTGDISAMVSPAPAAANPHIACPAAGLGAMKLAK